MCEMRSRSMQCVLAAITASHEAEEVNYRFDLVKALARAGADNTCDIEILLEVRFR